MGSSFILESFTGFEPLEMADLKFCSYKVLFLMAITSVHRVGILCSLMCCTPFIKFVDDGVILKPDPTFIP